MNGRYDSERRYPQPGRDPAATTSRTFPDRPPLAITLADGEDMEAKGNDVNDEYKIEHGGDKVAEVSKRWFRIRDTYGIDRPGRGRRTHPCGDGLHRQMTRD